MQLVFETAANDSCEALVDPRELRAGSGIAEPFRGHQDVDVVLQHLMRLWVDCSRSRIEGIGGISRAASRAYHKLLRRGRSSSTWLLYAAFMTTTASTPMFFLLRKLSCCSGRSRISTFLRDRSRFLHLPGLRRRTPVQDRRNFCLKVAFLLESFLRYTACWTWLLIELWLVLEPPSLTQRSLAQCGEGFPFPGEWLSTSILNGHCLILDLCDLT